MDKTVIEINNLVKSFGAVKAVNGISFKVKSGDLFAFLGLNGAGKSTTINIICGLLSRDSGEVLVNGYDIDDSPMDVKKSLGVVYQFSALDKDLTVYDNLESRASLYGIVGDAFKKRLEELVNLFSLSDILSRPLKKLSGGQKRRVDIVRALLHKPEILILDEPTTGLDPQTRKQVWTVINDLRKRDGITVFLTTHYMEEASESDFVVILDSGKVVASGTPHDLKNEYSGDYLTLYGVNEESVKILGQKYEKVKDGYRFVVENTLSVTKMITENPQLFVDYEVTKGKMDDVFLTVTGKTLDGGEN